MKEPAAKKEAAAKKEPVAAVKKETAQASCRRRPSPPPLACHILCSACNQTSPLSNTLRIKAPGSWWRKQQSTKRRSRRADAAPVTCPAPLAHTCIQMSSSRVYISASPSISDTQHDSVLRMRVHQFTPQNALSAHHTITVLR